MSRFLLPLFAFSFLLLLGVVTWSAQGLIETKHKQLDQAALNQVLDPSDYDNNLLDDVVLMSVKSGNSDFVKLDLLGLTRERLAFIAKQNGEVAYVIVPATASDGFNGYVDLLVALDMFGRIKSVRVVRTVRSDSL